VTIATLLYDSFDAVPAAADTAAPQEPAADAEAREAERLAAYENGYRSGWDDCLAAEQDALRRVGAELARNLSDLGFTYHEARAQLLAETEALLDAVFRTVLSRAAGPAVARRLVDDVSELAASALDLPVEIVVAPADAGTVRALLPGATTFPLSLVEEPALAEGQAYLRFGHTERVYDMNQLSQRLCEAITARTASPSERMNHG
jgi:flagellar biosynthesis/type III secretory pathway protein FliH